METETDGGGEKKGDAIKHSEPAMAADDGMKEDGAEAVPEGVKGAAAHAPAAEGVPQPVPNMPPPNAEGGMEGWKFAPRTEWYKNRKRGAFMVWNATKQEAIKFVTDLLKGATHDAIRVLPNATDKGNGWAHRFAFVTMDGDKLSDQLAWGITASEQGGRVVTPQGLGYRVDVGKDSRKVGATPRPVHPVQSPAPTPAAKNTEQPRAAGTWLSGDAYHQAYPPLQQPKPAPMHDPVPHPELQEVRNEVKKMGLLVEKLLSSREADQKHEAPDEASTLLRKEMAELKEENGKLKKEQLRAAAAAEAAETARLAQLAAQSKAHSVRMEKVVKAQEELRARLEETITQVQAKNAEITRLVDQREAAAAKEYCTPQKVSLAEYPESKAESEAGEEENDFKRNFEDLAWLQRVNQRQRVKLHKKQGATPPSRQSPVSGGSRSRDQVEPTGETPTQPKARSRKEEE
jgi:hypothetical protein